MKGIKMLPIKYYILQINALFLKCDTRLCVCLEIYNHDLLQFITFFVVYVSTPYRLYKM